MEQLSGLDAAFVHQDSQRTPMHITAVLVYDIGENGQLAISLAELRRLAAKRLAEIPLFQRKLQQVPMGMDTPYWVYVPGQHWDRQIGATSLPEAGNWWAFQRLLADLHGRRMNLDQPLWEMHLVHGLVDMECLPSHCQALVLKIHHSAIDGISMAAIINALHRNPEEVRAGRNRRTAAPSQWELWTRANLNSLSRQFKMAETMRNIFPGFMRARKTREQFRDLPPVQRGASRFNDRVKAGRNTGCVLLPMDEVVAVKRTVRRVTFNDIAMACVSGALREYLRHHGQLPSKSLVGGIPINLRSPGDADADGNKIATMMVGLATHMNDPVERLRTIHRYAVAGKKQIDALGTGTVMDISDSVSPGVLAEGIRGMARASRVIEMPVPFHTMISNVPGPQERMILGEAELVVPMGLGPIRDNMGLFHIVSSSPAMLSISFSACRRLLPDAEFYHDCLWDSFVELREQALGT